MPDAPTEVERLADAVLACAQGDRHAASDYELWTSVRNRLICMGSAQLSRLLAKVEEGGHSDILARIVSELWPQEHLAEAKAA